MERFITKRPNKIMLWGGYMQVIVELKTID